MISFQDARVDADPNAHSQIKALCVRGQAAAAALRLNAVTVSAFGMFGLGWRNKEGTSVKIVLQSLHPERGGETNTASAQGFQGGGGHFLPYFIKGNLKNIYFILKKAFIVVVRNYCRKYKAEIKKRTFIIITVIYCLINYLHLEWKSINTFKEILRTQIIATIEKVKTQTIIITFKQLMSN